MHSRKTSNKLKDAFSSFGASRGSDNQTEHEVLHTKYQ